MNSCGETSNRSNRCATARARSEHVGRFLEAILSGQNICQLGECGNLELRESTRVTELVGQVRDASFCLSGELLGLGQLVLEAKHPRQKYPASLASKLVLRSGFILLREIGECIDRPTGELFRFGKISHAKEELGPVEVVGRDRLTVVEVGGIFFAEPRQQSFRLIPGDDRFGRLFVGHPQHAQAAVGGGQFRAALRLVGKMLQQFQVAFDGDFKPIWASGNRPSFERIWAMWPYVVPASHCDSGSLRASLIRRR